MTFGSRPVFLCFGRIEQRAIDLVPPDRQNPAACILFLLKLHISVSGLTSTRIMCVQALSLVPFLCSEAFSKLSVKVHNHTANMLLFPCMFCGLLFSPTTSCTCHVELRSTLKNICCAKETHVHRTDISGRIWCAFPGLACSSR